MRFMEDIYFRIFISCLIISAVLVSSQASAEAEYDELYAVVVKFNPEGEIQWAKTDYIDEICYESYNTDFGSIAVDDQGYAYITGYYDKYLAGHSGLLTKYAPDGTIAWRIKTDDTPESYMFYDLALHESGDIFISGRHGWFAAIFKYGENGNLYWDAYYPLRDWPWFDWARPAAIAVDDQGCAFVTGSVYIFGQKDILTLKYDGQGNLIWKQTYNSDIEGGLKDPAGKKKPAEDCGNAIAVDDTGNVYICGRSSASKGWNLLTIKYDDRGDLEWTAIYTDLFGSNDLTSISTDPSGDVISSGYLCSGDECDFIVAKYYTQGARAWLTKYETGSDIRQEEHSMAVDTQGNIYITGYDHDLREVMTIKLDAGGDVLWTRSEPASSDAMPQLVLDSEDNVIVLLGDPYGFVKYDGSGNEIGAGQYDPGKYRILSCDSIAVDPEGNVLVAGSSVEYRGYDDDYFWEDDDHEDGDQEDTGCGK